MTRRKKILRRFLESVILTASAAAMFLPGLSAPSEIKAANPVVQNIYTADGAPMVYNDTFYLFTGHDEDNATNYVMNEWRCYSSKDMQNWTDNGPALTYKTFPWAKGEAWASQCIEKNGKFYFYSTVTSSSGGGRAIGVAVADKPEGPYTDPIGKPLAGPNWSYIDPTVFIDDDGQAYLYWGNGGLWYVKLNDDMISYNGSPVSVNVKGGEFGKMYTEGPYLYKHGDWYYMVYAADGIPENIAYSMSKSPTGPWTYKGVIMEHGGNSFTNHPGIIDYKGHSYFTYHTGTLPGGSGFARSMCVEEFTYNSDGTIPQIKRTTNGCAQISSLDPYKRVEAETICIGTGIETEKCSEGGMNVCDISNGENIKVSGVDFGTGASSFNVRISSATSGGKLELHLDSITGPVIGTCDIPGTGGWQTWKTISCNISGASSKHDLYMKFTGGSGFLYNMNWWQFVGAGGQTNDNPTQTPGGNVSKQEYSVSTLTRLIKALHGTEPFKSDEEKLSFDFCEDGKINIADIICLKSFILEKSDEPAKEPVEEPAKLTKVANPIIWSDVPDMDIIRVGDTYYMVSTTMYFNPGAPIMKSKDLVSWEIASYVYDTLESNDKTNLTGNASAYGQGSWAASIRYNKGTFYVFFASNDQGKSYIFQTNDIENGTWKKYTINGVYHDASILFDDDGKNYLVYGSGTISIKQLNSAVTGFEPNGVSKVLYKCPWDGLGEGSHIQKINGYYYIFNIGSWPRTEFCMRSKTLLGNYENQTLLKSGLGSYSPGVAQGGIVDTPDGKWYALLFQDHGAVGRIPVLVPLTWSNNWPKVEGGKAPTFLTINTNYTGTKLAASDEFTYSSGQKLRLEWQWNHNPDNTKWSVTEKPGNLRLKTGAIATDLLSARNSLTQRTEGPSCTSIIKMDVSNMKNGDYAGLAAFQEYYGQIGVYVNNGTKKIFMAENGKSGQSSGIGCKFGSAKIIAEKDLPSNTIYLKIEYLFSNYDANAGTSSNDIDQANFFYSLDGTNWTKLGNTLKMKYTLTLFTGYRSAIFNYATKSAGGYVDIDYYHYSRAEYQPEMKK